MSAKHSLESDLIRLQVVVYNLPTKFRFKMLILDAQVARVHLPKSHKLNLANYFI